MKIYILLVLSVFLVNFGSAGQSVKLSSGAPVELVFTARDFIRALDNVNIAELNSLSAAPFFSDSKYFEFQAKNFPGRSEHDNRWVNFIRVSDVMFVVEMYQVSQGETMASGKVATYVFHHGKGKWMFVPDIYYAKRQEALGNTVFGTTPPAPIQK